jgi:hypothetical protein
MKKLIIAIAVLSSMASCIDHPEARRNFEAKRNSSQFTKRVIKPIDGFVLSTFLVDTLFKVNDTIIINDTKVVIIR